MKHRKSLHRYGFLICGVLGLLNFSACSRPTPVLPEPLPGIPGAHSKPLFFLQQAVPEPVVKTGLEVFLERTQDYEGQRFALLANQTAVDHNLVHAVELLKTRVDLRLLLSPEHGLFGAENAGDAIGEERDGASGILSQTTYRKNPMQIAKMIQDVDIILFDIQDIGVRSYTYIYSMAYLMQAAALAEKQVIILDRPNPINGLKIEGNLLEQGISSFVGMYPIPYRHGMTTGELALLFNTEFKIGCKLEVIAMEGWTRDMWFDETGLNWVPTSPHVPDAETILPMIATGTYGELGKLSEGVGVTVPFELSGGPWIKDPQTFAAALMARQIPGVIFRPTFFKPYYGRHAGEICGGVQIHVIDRDAFSPYLAGLLIMRIHQELYPDLDLFENQNRWDMFTKVMGSEQIRIDLQAGRDPLEMASEWIPGLEEFRRLREPYLLYE